MRQVTFGLRQRVEMAAAWAFPISLLVAAVLAFVWRRALLPALLLCWGLSLCAFVAFPLYSRHLRPASAKRGLSLERGGIQALLWAACVAGLAVYGIGVGQLSWAWLWRWAVLAAVLVIVVTVDLAGMTPVLKSGTQEERLYRVVLDPARCLGEGICVEVCPRACFRVQEVADMPGAARCVRCSACVVQCPGDALSFVRPSGAVISPQDVREHKLNLMGTRPTDA